MFEEYDSDDTLVEEETHIKIIDNFNIPSYMEKLYKKYDINIKNDDTKSNKIIIDDIYFTYIKDIINIESSLERQKINTLVHASCQNINKKYYKPYLGILNKKIKKIKYNRNRYIYNKLNYKYSYKDVTDKEFYKEFYNYKYQYIHIDDCTSFQKITKYTKVSYNIPDDPDIHFEDFGRFPKDKCRFCGLNIYKINICMICYYKYKQYYQIFISRYPIIKKLPNEKIIEILKLYFTKNNIIFNINDIKPIKTKKENKYKNVNLYIKPFESYENNETHYTYCKKVNVIPKFNPFNKWKENKTIVDNNNVFGDIN